MKSDDKEIENRMLKRLDIENKIILEVGCGKGRLTKILAETANRVIAVSPFPDEIEEASLLKLPNVEFQVMDGQDLKLPDSKFDYVVFTFSLHHIIEPEKALKEAIRVLKPGGKIALLEPNIDAQYNELFYIVHDETEATLRARKAADVLLPNHKISDFQVTYLFENEEDVVNHFASSEEDFYHLDPSDKEKKDKILSKIKEYPAKISDKLTLIIWEG